MDSKWAIANCYFGHLQLAVLAIKLPSPLAGERVKVVIFIYPLERATRGERQTRSPVRERRDYE